MEYIHTRHHVHLLTYHIILVTKYRRPVIDEAVGSFLKEYMRELASNAGGELITAESDRDHIHFLVSLPPDKAPGTMIRVWKTALSKEIHKQPELMQHVSKHLLGDVPFWSASYFVATTGSVSLETVKQYINSQQSEEHQKRRYVRRADLSIKKKKRRA